MNYFLCMPPVRFTRPPVTEVVCGITFDLRELPLRTVHVGQFWERVRQRFPNVSEVPPLPAIIELLAAPSSSIPEALLTNLPPLRRSWFSSEDGFDLLQLQEDRFLYNWKWISKDTPYPEYTAIIAEFEKYVAEFDAFAKDESVGRLVIQQFELSYVNHIDSAHGYKVGEETKLFVDHLQSVRSERFLPPPEGINWVTSYNLPNAEGRLHVAARSGMRTMDGEKLVSLDLTARGISKDATVGSLRHWFDTAHDWITLGFVDITAPHLHEIWGKV